jgi:hypothetical protein
MLDEQSVFKPLLAGFLFGATASYLKLVRLDAITMSDAMGSIIGGGIGGSLIFGIIWKISRTVKPSYVVETKPSNTYWKKVGFWLLGIFIGALIAGAISIQNNSPSPDLKGQMTKLGYKSERSAMSFQKSFTNLA